MISFAALSPTGSLSLSLFISFHRVVIGVCLDIELLKLLLVDCYSLLAENETSIASASVGIAPGRLQSVLSANWSKSPQLVCSRP